MALFYSKSTRKTVLCCIAKGSLMRITWPLAEMSFIIKLGLYDDTSN